MISAATAAATAQAAQPVPTFPKDFYMSEQSNIAINQGGYATSTATCCSKDARQCKIQSIIEGSDVREQGSKNRTRVDSPEGIIINWFGGGVAKQMAMLPGSSAKCPLPTRPHPDRRRRAHRMNASPPRPQLDARPRVRRVLPARRRLPL